MSFSPVFPRANGRSRPVQIFGNLLDGVELWGLNVLN